jgi:hypothetical protein
MGDSNFHGNTAGVGYIYAGIVILAIFGFVFFG